MIGELNGKTNGSLKPPYEAMGKSDMPMQEFKDEMIHYKAKILSILHYGQQMFYDFKNGGREKIILECKVLVSDEYFKYFIPMLLDIYLTRPAEEKSFIKYILVKASPMHQQDIVDNILSLLKSGRYSNDQEKIALLIGIVFESYAQGNMAHNVVKGFIENVKCLIDKRKDYEYPLQILDLLIEICKKPKLDIV